MGQELGKKLTKWYRNRTKFELTLLWSILGLIIFAMFMNLAVESYFGFVQGKVISKEQCVQVGVSTALSMQDNSIWQNIFIDYKPIISLLLALLGISWIIHGFQVRLLA